MTQSRPGPRRVRLASLLAALALAAPLAAAPGVPAAAADEATVQVWLTAADIAQDTLTIRGTVTNTGTVPLNQVTVDLWRSPDRLVSPQGVANALAAPTTTPGTARIVEDTNRTRPTGEEPLAPGASVPFTVAGSLDALGLRAADTTWWAGVDATGRIGQRRAQPVGSARTLVTHSTTPGPVATVVELSAPPRQLKKDLFRTDDLRTDVTTGRLAQLLTAVEEGQADWVIDPSLLTELEDMADGYRIQTPDGSVAGTGEEDAAAWLARVRALPHDRGATQLFGAPDLAGLAVLRDPTIPAAITAGTDAAAPDLLPRLAVVEHPDAATIEFAAGLAPTLVTLDTTTPANPVSVGATTVVAATTQPHPTVTSPLLPSSPLTRAAARAAHVRALGAQVVWVRSTEDLAAATEPLPAALQGVTLADIVALPAEPWTPPPARTPTLTALDGPRLGRAIDLRHRMEAYAAAAPASGVGEFVGTQTARTASRWWVEDAPGQDAWLTAIEQRVALPEGDMVALDATARFSMTGARSEFPVTVTNHLRDPITVAIAATTDNPQRIRLVAPDPVEIAPGASSTVLLQAESAGGGVVVARVHVQTPDGHRLTPDREIAVETTNFGTIGWVIVIASGLVLVVTTSRRIHQVRGQRKGEDG